MNNALLFYSECAGHRNRMDMYIQPLGTYQDSDPIDPQ